MLVHCPYAATMHFFCPRSDMSLRTRRSFLLLTRFLLLWYKHRIFSRSPFNSRYVTVSLSWFTFQQQSPQHTIHSVNIELKVLCLFKVIETAINRQHLCHFLLVFNSNLGHIFNHSWNCDDNSRNRRLYPPISHFCRGVCVCVTFVHCVKTTKHIFEIFSSSGSQGCQAIPVFPYQTAWQYSDGNPLTEASIEGGVDRNRDSQPIFGFTACY